MERRPIDTLVQQLKQRRRLLNAVRWSVWGALLAGTASFGIALAWAFRGETFAPAGVASLWAAVPVGALFGLIAGWLRPVDVLPLLRAVDRKAGAQDRLASAWQLAGHHRAGRVALITADALDRVGPVTARQVLPFRTPRALGGVPVVLAALFGALWWGGRTPADAGTDSKPTISPQQWQKVRRDFEHDWKAADDPERKKLAKDLRRLGKTLTALQDKRSALREVAKLRAEFAARRNRLKSRDIHLRRAAAAALQSEMLKKLKDLLKQGDYQAAADELKKLSELLRLMKLRPDAEQLEQLAKDFERLAKQLEPHEELHKACRQCADASQSLNQQDLSQALKDLAERLEKESPDLKKNDALCDACNALQRLERQLAGMKPCPVCHGKNSRQCPHCNGSGNGRKFVQRPGNGRSGNRKGRKGGLKAGKGSAKNWFGGSLADAAENRLATQTTDREGAGRFEAAGKTVATKENAQSALAHKKKFLELVKKAEADLDLETVPPGYRDYLRRYFKAIQPKDDAPATDKK